MLKDKGKRDVFLDMVRILACLFVIYNHSSAFFRYSNDPFSIKWIWNTACSIMCKAGVPLFFMISGCTLLGKSEPYGRVLKRCLRILVCLIVWSLIYFILDAYLHGESPDFYYIIREMVSSNYWHLWYLYAYIGFLITLPVLRPLAVNIDRTGFLVLTVIAFVLTCLLPVFEYSCIPVNSFLKSSWLIADTFMYPVIGYYVYEKTDIKLWTGRRLILLWVVNIALFAFSGISEYMFLAANPGNPDETFIRTGCLVNSLAIFISLRLFAERVKIKEGRVERISQLGRLTFGIYLLHIVVLNKIKPLSELWKALDRWSMAGVYITVISVFVICACLVYVIRKIPVLKKLV